jgi:hypothetical protein
MGRKRECIKKKKKNNYMGDKETNQQSQITGHKDVKTKLKAIMNS